MKATNEEYVMSDHEKRSRIETYIAAYNDFDVDGMVALLHPDIVFEHHSGEFALTTTGLDAFRELAENAKMAFAERRQTIIAMTLHAGGASIEIAFTGKPAADLPDGRKAGEVMELSGRTEFEFKNGRISRLADYV